MINFLLVFGDWTLLLLRLVLGLILIVHGLPKIKDLKKTSENFKGMGFKPGAVWGSLVAVLEVAGGVAIMAGFLTQIFAILLAVQFLVILLTVKRNASFKGGSEFDLLLFVTFVLLATTGGGSYSLDGVLNIFLY